MLRNFINTFLNCKYIFYIFKNEFLVLCIVTTVFINVINLCYIYIYIYVYMFFYDYLNFCCFTSFCAVKIAVESFMTSIH